MRCTKCSGLGTLRRKGQVISCGACNGTGKICDLCREPAKYWRPIDSVANGKYDFVLCQECLGNERNKWYDDRGYPTDDKRTE